MSHDILPGRRLLTVVAITCAFLVATGAVLVCRSYDTARAGVIADAELRCRIAAAQAYGDRLSLVRLLQALASDPAARRGSADAIRERLAAVSGKSFGFTGGLSWLDTGGVVRASTDGRLGAQISDAWWREVVETGQWTTSAALISPAFAEEVIVFAVPTFDELDVVNGVLAAGLGTAWLRTSVEAQARQFGAGRYGARTDLFILESAGQLLAGPGVDATRTIPDVSTYRRIMAERGRVASGAQVDVTGPSGRSARLVSYAYTGVFGEIIVLERSADDAFAPSRRTLLQQLLGLILVTVIVFIAAMPPARRLDRLARNRDKVHRAEHGVVVALQHSLLGARLPQGASARYLPAASVLNVGGDWYDVIHLSGDRYLLIVGDVVGHGVRAALAMGQVRSATRALAGRLPHPAELLTELDRYVAELDDVVFCTAVCAVVDLPARQLWYAAAGHPPGLLRHPDGTITTLTGPVDAPLGLASVRRHEAASPVIGDELLVLYTDGLVERRNEMIDEGIARLAGAVASRSPRADTWCDEVINEALRGEPHTDDVVLLTFDFDQAARSDSATRPEVVNR